MAVADLDGLLMADRAVDLVFDVHVVDKQRRVPFHCRKFEIKGASILMLVECDIVSGNIGANEEALWMNKLADSDLLIHISNDPHHPRSSYDFPSTLAECFVEANQAAPVVKITFCFPCAETWQSR